MSSVTAPPPSLTGALQDRYRLEREIGHGGMATVYLARDIRHQRPVAVKVLRPELSDLVSRDRFLREIEIVSRLQHPNILALFDSGSAAESLYYVMPLVEGESLRARLDREKQLPVDDVLSIAREVADALGYAHARGVIHRDIKPGNILLTGGHAVVADFGIARALGAASGEHTTGGLAVGTPAYMSPEQASGHDQVDARSDVYSLACVVYEMLAGEPPFTGRTAQAIIARHLTEPAPSLRVVRPLLAPELQEAIEAGLAKVPADRFSTAERFAAALDDARSGRGGRRRRRWRAGTAAVIVGATLAAGWLLLARGPALDANKVLVFPLVEVAGPRGPDGLGEAVAVIIESALEHTEPLQWLDGWQELDPEQRSDPALLTGKAARGLATSRGTRWYTTGSVVRGGDSTTVVLQLNDAAGDSLVRQASATAPAELGAQIGLRVVNELMVPILAPGRTIDLTALANRRPTAVSLWLQGERDYRRGNFDSALVLLRHAVAEDSALAVAAVRGAQAASWKNLTPEAASLAGVALEHVALLPERQAAFTRGLADYLGGRADSAVEWLSQALVRSPDWIEAHMVLGEVYHHLLPRASAPLDSLAEVEFKAAARDTGFAPPLFHLAEIALRRGDMSQAESAADRFARAGSGTEERQQLDLMLACARQARGAKAVDWETPAREVPMVLLSAAKLLSVAGAFPGCAEDAARALLAERNLDDLRYGAYILLENLQVAQGQMVPLMESMDSMASGRYSLTAATATLVNALVDVPGFSSRAEGGIAVFRDQYGPQYEDSLESGRLRLLSAWYAKSGRLDEATRLHQLLTTRAAATRDPEVALDASAAAVHLLLARRDSAAALRAVERLEPVAVRDQLTWGYAESLPVERLLHARLLLARGRYAEAIEVADVFDHPTPVVYVSFLPASLAVRYQAAQSLGQRQQAARYRERMKSLGFTEPT